MGKNIENNRETLWPSVRIMFNSSINKATRILMLLLILFYTFNSFSIAFSEYLSDYDESYAYTSYADSDNIDLDKDFDGPSKLLHIKKFEDIARGFEGYLKTADLLDRDGYAHVYESVEIIQDPSIILSLASVAVSSVAFTLFPPSATISLIAQVSDIGLGVASILTDLYNNIKIKRLVKYFRDNDNLETTDISIPVTSTIMFNYYPIHNVYYNDLPIGISYRYFNNLANGAEGLAVTLKHTEALIKHTFIHAAEISLYDDLDAINLTYTESIVTVGLNLLALWMEIDNYGNDGYLATFSILEPIDLYSIVQFHVLMN